MPARRRIFLRSGLRTFRANLARFVAIAVIVALGAGFYAGLNSAGAVMRADLGRLADSAGLYDAILRDPSGFSEDDLAKLENLPGVVALSRSRVEDLSFDVAAGRLSLRVEALPEEAADSDLRPGEPLAQALADALPEHPAASDAAPVPGAPILSEGRLPADSGECLLLVSTARKQGIDLGSHLRLAASSAEGEAALSQGSLEVVGLYESGEHLLESLSGRLSGGSDGSVLVLPEALSSPDEGAEAVRLRVDYAARGAADPAAERLASGELAEDLRADARAALDDRDGLVAADRGDNAGYRAYLDDSERIDRIASVFPLAFFLVAALVALTTVTRMVDDDRMLIGTYRSLGFSKRAIVLSYALSALVATAVGALIGIGLLGEALPWLIADAYTVSYAVPAPSLPIPLHPGFSLLAFGVAFASVGATAWLVARATVHAVPSQLLVPKAPPAGKSLLIERAGWFWGRLSFSWKVTLRNALRYKRRLFMTSFGIIGCTALLVCGLGLRDTVLGVIPAQFDRIERYGVALSLQPILLPEATRAERLDAEKVLGLAQSDPAAFQQAALAGALPMDPQRARELLTPRALTDADRERAVRILGPDVTGSWLAARPLVAVAGEGGPEVSVTGLGFEQPSDAASVMDLVSASDGSPIALTRNSVVITEKLAELTGAHAGDPIELYPLDASGERSEEPATLTVDAVARSYAGHLAFIGQGEWERVFEEPLIVSTFYGAGPLGATKGYLEERLLDEPEVVAVSFADDQRATYESTLAAVSSIVGVLIASAAALAFVVLYNLISINIAERRREIASLKVLGFTRREVDSYVFREMLLIVAVSALIGLGFGTLFEGYVARSAETEYLLFSLPISPASYALSFALTMLFALLVMLWMRRSLRAIDMVESLKSVE